MWRGLPWTSLVHPGRPIPAHVAAKTHIDDHLVATAPAFAQLVPQVQECHLMTGQRDYLLRVLVDDLDAYDDFVKTVLRSVSNISSMETSFAHHEVKTLTQAFEMRPAK